MHKSFRPTVKAYTNVSSNNTQLVGADVVGTSPIKHVFSIDHRSGVAYVLIRWRGSAANWAYKTLLA